MNSAEHASERSPSRLDVVVIGAGQAGLAMGYFLARQGRRFVILDGADSIGAAWRDRWDSLVLFTPRRYDGRVLRKTVDSRIGRRMRDRDVLVGSSPRELTRRFGVGLKPRLVGVSGRTAEFADGTPGSSCR